MATCHSDDDARKLSCVVALGADAWERLVPGRGRPKLHAFRALSDGPRTAPATDGDVFLHVRADRRDFCHELVRLIMEKLGDSVRVADERGACLGRDAGHRQSAASLADRAQTAAAHATSGSLSGECETAIVSNINSFH